ncbi:MAG: GyrI-like domain-containing protein [Bdellovibrionota bacterium]|nr:GyrI-like domain-containing protein [Bdellovibrionota bacterium]
MLKFAFGFFVAMILSFVGTGIYLGYYKNVDTSIGTPVELHLLGKDVTGPYHMVNKSIEEVEAYTRENNIPCPRSFGMYFDNPEQVEPEKLRSFVGCVIDQKLTEAPVDFRQESPKIEKAYMASFTGSPALGPLKVYPEARDWFERNKLVFPYALEIYLIKDSHFKTEYIFPIPIEKVIPESLKL